MNAFGNPRAAPSRARLGKPNMEGRETAGQEAPRPGCLLLRTLALLALTAASLAFLGCGSPPDRQEGRITLRAMLVDVPPGLEIQRPSWAPESHSGVRPTELALSGVVIEVRAGDDHGLVVARQTTDDAGVTTVVLLPGRYVARALPAEDLDGDPVKTIAGWFAGRLTGLPLAIEVRPGDESAYDVFVTPR